MEDLPTPSAASWSPRSKPGLPFLQYNLSRTSSPFSYRLDPRRLHLQNVQVKLESQITHFFFLALSSPISSLRKLNEQGCFRPDIDEQVDRGRFGRRVPQYQLPLPWWRLLDVVAITRGINSNHGGNGIFQRVFQIVLSAELNTHGGYGN
jgi:hypothetical protein